MDQDLARRAGRRAPAAVCGPGTIGGVDRVLRRGRGPGQSLYAQDPSGSAGRSLAPRRQQRRHDLPDRQPGRGRFRQRCRLRDPLEPHRVGRARAGAAIASRRSAGGRCPRFPCHRVTAARASDGAAGPGAGLRGHRGCRRPRCRHRRRASAVDPLRRPAAASGAGHGAVDPIRPRPRPARHRVLARAGLGLWHRQRPARPVAGGVNHHTGHRDRTSRATQLGPGDVRHRRRGRSAPAGRPRPGRQPAGGRDHAGHALGWPFPAAAGARARPRRPGPDRPIPGRTGHGRHRVHRGGSRPRLSRRHPQGEPALALAVRTGCRVQDRRPADRVTGAGRGPGARGGPRQGVRRGQGRRRRTAHRRGRGAVGRMEPGGAAAKPARRHQRAEPEPGHPTALPIRAGSRGSAGTAARASLLQPLPDAHPDRRYHRWRAGARRRFREPGGHRGGDLPAARTHRTPHAARRGTVRAGRRDRPDGGTQR